MITKRLFVLGSTAAAGLAPYSPPMPARADTAPMMRDPEFALTAVSATLTLQRGEQAIEGLGYAAAGGARAVLRVRRGQEVILRLTNDLAEPTSVRWHGLRALGALDDALSATSREIPAKQSRVIRFTPLDAGTAWFHPAPSTSNQAARGLRGVLVVEEPDAPAVDDDVVVLFEDWLLTADHALRFGSTAPADVATAVVTVNGAPAPLEVERPPGSRIRLRLVNGSVQRVMLVACEGAHPSIVAIDGQPSELFKPVRDTIPIGPGARFDYVIDLPAVADATVRLILKGTERVAGGLEPDRTLASFRAVGAATASRPPPSPLTPNPALPRQIPLEASKRAELVIETRPGAAPGWTINGVSGVPLPAAPILRVKRGDSITLGFTNKSAATVPVRIFGHAMRLLHAKDDGWEPYWRDSVLLPPGSRNHLAFVADTPGRWLIEASVDDMALAGLRCWFEVTTG